ncbi:bis(5'-nucleosyl)-tetraphosphatase [Nitrososphaera viennensis]|uniref:Bis(5'-nucleosyl)-tetraphosphatase [asymmetrical] n=2 Tax=Nitrososphaera viennensis TaxID=1034015 RepID=A0A060HHA9_9ARCH|nr:NUDIX domain-containing protein [Nitrososphaera viennensis]AIC15969.1 putative NUDIX hydrolase [Nitrososphaera viennensis EN76]UVS67945.1 NUDIX domain-containing protein [Nitrososphaera viennensis]
MVDERSAGAVVVFMPSDSGKPEYLLLHYTAGHWDFPKGNIEAGETEKEAAAREIREETGIADVEFVEGFRQIISYRYRKARRLVDKEVVLFLVRTKTRDVKISHEHIGFAWKNYDDAIKQLTYRNARNLLEAAMQFMEKEKPPAA